MKKSYCYILPSVFTAGNLFCGFLAIYFATVKQFETASWLILIAMVFDIMDGRVARLTKGTSEFGAEFDSIADVVSFGVAPAILILYAFFPGEDVFLQGMTAAFVYLLCGALRLARFNVSSASENFSGIPIPGGAAVVVTLVLFDGSIPGGISTHMENHRFFLLLFVTLISMMMVSTVPYPSLKKSKGQKGGINVLVNLIFILVIIFGCIISPEKFMFITAISYAISGPVYSFWLLFGNRTDKTELVVDLEIPEIEEK
jgi:CDP-diacylglycerol--serine O-phosphatidyltransferase